MGSIKETIDMENTLQRLLDKIMFTPSNEDFNTQMLAVDVEALKESLAALLLKTHNESVADYEFYGHLESVTKFVGMIAEELSSKGTALLIDHRYVKKNQKQPRPKRKLRIPQNEED